MLEDLSRARAAGLIAAVFSGIFLATALLNYRRPQLHRRFIMLTSITMVAAALTRIGSFRVFGGINPHIVTLIGTSSLVGAL